MMFIVSSFAVIYPLFPTAVRSKIMRDGTFSFIKAKPELFVLPTPTAHESFIAHYLINNGKKTHKQILGCGVSVAHAYGKYQWNVNVQEIVNGCDILVATTGRLMSLIRDRIVHAHTIKMFVLDDADQLLEPEFVKDLRDLEHSPGFPKVPFYIFFN